MGCPPEQGHSDAADFSAIFCAFLCDTGTPICQAPKRRRKIGGKSAQKWAQKSVHQNSTQKNGLNIPFVWEDGSQKKTQKKSAPNLRKTPAPKAWGLQTVHQCMHLLRNVLFSGGSCRIVSYCGGGGLQLIPESANMKSRQACTRCMSGEQLQNKASRAHSSQKILHTQMLVLELISRKITFQLHTNIFLELIPQKLHCTYSFVIQRITCKNCLGFFSWKIPLQLHKIMFSEFDWSVFQYLLLVVRG